jgi:hypothetical protein
MRLLYARHVWTACALLMLVVLWMTPAGAHDVEKMVFLVVDEDEVIASNTKLGRFDRLRLGAGETVKDYQVANAVAVVITNRRAVAYGVLRGGWNGRRISADEQVESVEVQDYSATLVTSDRILNYTSRTGVWSETKR